jgi:lauroyl/myristoyl acyltransferase
MANTYRGIKAQRADESLRRLRWRWRMAIVRGRLDMYSPGRESVRAAIKRHLSDQNPSKTERRFLEYLRRRSLVDRWLELGMPHAERVVRIQGSGHLEQALSGGAGAILASAHFGHARLIKPILRVHGWPAMLVGGRAAQGWPRIAAPDLPVGLNLRPHFAALGENKPLIMLADGRVAASLIHIRVRGLGVDFAPGTMRIARAAGAPVLPTFVLDEGTFRDPLAIRLVIHPPLELQNTADAADDARENLKRLAAVYAEELDQNPHNHDWRKVSESGDWRPVRIPGSEGATKTARRTLPSLGDLVMRPWRTWRP